MAARPVSPASVPPGWHPPRTAPRDGTPILGDFGWPWPLPAVWDPYDRRWSVCAVECCPMENKLDNIYWESETELPVALRAWHPMPELPHPIAVKAATKRTEKPHQS